MARAPERVVLNSSMNWNEVSIHTTPNSYPESATLQSEMGAPDRLPTTPSLCSRHGKLIGISIALDLLV
ncbi:MAG: hypothetical protein KME16_06415 [Scytolyngbya sp. HA4215-MV1]|nr:hypothetical protein [Scytolyngbya sp. HA4215-MV1]